jgi:protein-disulfide isomerase
MDRPRIAKMSLSSFVRKMPRTSVLVIGAIASLAIVGIAYAAMTGVFKGAEQPPVPTAATIPVAQLMEAEPLPDIWVAKAGTDEGKDAPITIVEYASMTCPHCAAFHASTYPVLVSKYIETGKARFVLREFPLDDLATAAFMLARCAGPEKRNAMIDLLFEQQQTWAYAKAPDEALANLVKQAGIGHDKFESCLNDQALRAKIYAERETASTKFGVNATPTFFINGVRHNGEFGPADLDKLLGPLAK